MGAAKKKKFKGERGVGWGAEGGGALGPSSKFATVKSKVKTLMGRRGGSGSASEHC